LAKALTRNSHHHGKIIIGIFASLFVQTVKAKFGGGVWTLAIVGVASVAAAALYILAVSHWLLDAVVKILVVAGTFYTFVFQRLGPEMPPGAILGAFSYLPPEPRLQALH
jgi:hypothetical protein